VTSEALRAYHQTTSSDNNSERSTSTASQSQCGHSDSKKFHSGRHNANNSISYISSGSSEHQIALALALANTEGYLAQVRKTISIEYNQLKSMWGFMILSFLFFLFLHNVLIHLGTGSFNAENLHNAR